MNQAIDFSQRKIAHLNDQLRKQHFGHGHGKTVLTQGVSSLNRNDLKRCLKAVRNFDSFDEENDPYGEHDFGVVEVELCDGEKEVINFKIDYYDSEMEVHSENNSNNNVTNRVMTIMFASEY